MAHYRCLIYYFHLILLSCTIQAYYFDSPIANISTSWTNNPCTNIWRSFESGPEIRIIVDVTLERRKKNSLHMAFGFYRGNDSDSFLLAVVLYFDDSYFPGLLYSMDPQILWSANRNNPIRENCTLKFTEEGDLILRDVDGSFVWSTNTSGRSIVGLRLTKMGNLILYDQKKSLIWQSIDHPTDTLVLGQKLVEGQKLISWASPTSWSEGLYSLSVTDQGVYALYDSNPPICYYKTRIVGDKVSKQPSLVKFENGSLSYYILDPGSGKADEVKEVPQSNGIQYIRLGSDGHLRAYEWKSLQWTEVADLLSDSVQKCFYPEVCGNYGICSNGQCSCPEPNYFRPVDDRKPELGCSLITPLSCETSQYHHLLDLKDLSFSNFDIAIIQTSLESCKQACLKNCSCKLAFFEPQDNDSNGLCVLQSTAVSLVDMISFKNSPTYSAHVKVQGTSLSAPPPEVDHNPKILRTILGISIGIFLIANLLILYRKMKSCGKDDSHLDRLSLVPTRFCYRELKEATGNFCTKIGQGGFGSVYKGVLVDGTEIAVKRLDGLGQIKDSFLAEVETIGQIHHVNLVRLIGFCAKKSHRLLVYDYMCNGSLDKWIFCKEQGASLDWKTRQKIISDLAKGLAYLHEDCQQRILHLDIKPQNILLDEKFNAKISDFGLSKLIEKDKSKVVAAMRGTPGYLAPEWLGSVITDKVDVYSFGIVVLEILCGRKVFDSSKPEECMHLLNLLEKKAEEGQFHDMIDDHCDDMKNNEEEAMKMLELSAWCIQNDLSRRPSMSMVVKVLEGLADIELNLKYKFVCTATSNIFILNNKDTTLVLPSVLSGPR